MSDVDLDLKFDERGLIPAIVQDHASGRVLMLGFMNRESLQRTRATDLVHFFSRSRGRLWQKGEASGHVLHVRGIKVDCDRDALLVLAEPAGPTCHTGAVSCFFASVSGAGDAAVSVLIDLARTVAKRAHDRPEGSYTATLLNQGIDRILRKVGEESAELIVAAKNADREAIKNEAADLLYHVLVALEERGVGVTEVLQVLEQRGRA